VRVSLSWLREYVELPANVSGVDLDRALVSLGIEVESVDDLASSVVGDLVVGRVVEMKQTLLFSEADVVDEHGRLVARASSTCMPVPEGQGRE